MNLISITQAMFMLGFVSMAASTFYFVLQRGEYKAEHRSTITYAAVITFIAAIMYWQMKDIVMFPGGPADASVISNTMPVRYLDWILTTPLLLAEFGMVATLAGAAKGTTYKLIVADIVMIVTGYLGEIGVAGSGGNYVNFILSSLAWAYIAYTIWKIELPKGTAEIKRVIANMKYFVIFGWAIYPIGYMMLPGNLLEGLAAGADLTKTSPVDLAYNIADAVNKIGFGLVVYSIAKGASSK